MRTTRPTTERGLRVGVIGCGAISHEHLPFLSGSPRADLVAVCDRSPATAAHAMARYGATAWTTDADELLAVHRPEVVHVLTPPSTHRQLGEAALRAGAHLICEKPLTPTAADTAAVLDLAEGLGLVAVESHNLLYNDPVTALDRLVARGRIGQVREVDILLSLDLTAGPFGDENLSGPGVDLPGGAVHDFLPHLAYLFCHFARPHQVDHVTGSLLKASDNARVGFDHLDALVNAGPVRGRLRLASDLAPDAFRVIVRGTVGTAETDLYNPFLRVEGGRNVGKRAPVEQLVSGLRLVGASASNLRDKVMQHTTYHGLPRMLDQVYASLQNGAPSPITPSDIGATAALVDRLVSLAEAPA